MKIALIGYGAMGQLVGRLVLEQGHEIAVTLDVDAADRRVEDLAEALGGCDVAIDFSIADTVPKNVEACALAGVPIVVGTTGWLAQLPEVQRVVSDHDGALIYGANFSVGVQVFCRIAAHAAELFRDLDSYDGFIEEAHHKRKRDAPSGTAIQLNKIVAEQLGHEVPVASTRAGYIPGTQIGKRVHLSAAAQIGGVLEPAGAMPVIIEDDVIVGGNCGVYEGTIVRERAVLASGVIVTGSTPVFDLVREEVYRRSEDAPLEIPAGAVVVPGARALQSEKGREWGLSLYAPVIVKYRDEKTDAATQLEDLLR